MVVATGGSTVFDSNGKLSTFFKHCSKVVFYFFPSPGFVENGQLLVDEK